MSRTDFNGNDRKRVIGSLMRRGIRELDQIATIDDLAHRVFSLLWDKVESSIGHNESEMTGVSAYLKDTRHLFMEQRTSYHDTHNRLVTVFLRKLEYYQGILFLTSNRGIQFDDAILSRIHLTIEYEDLTREFRRDLWSTFLSKARTMQGPAVVEEDDLRRLEALDLNGREIKNIAAIAHALAEADVNQVNYKYLELAAESNKKFSKEFGRGRPVDGMYV
ncbi:ATPase AAA-type [Penicillium alfredii]|uniref:ATPase AAA-type n=1 Tax=Penicillium alfredii TaxID=1506179 RepID=A0A9W9G444_9EURO|nr:ATPase AAA-type [Penicillium alfredii]KAJ5111820.1 ATPase AAA-type [Penicillium alfredii]